MGAHDTFQRNEKPSVRRFWAIAVLLTLAALAFRLGLALGLPNDESDDGLIYTQIAVNVLSHKGYSMETEEPYTPTHIRTPGYPLTLAGIYAVFGKENDTVVRIVQALVDTAGCWIIALVCALWSPAGWDEARKHRAMLWALALVAACPFTAIYVACILTETWALFFGTLAVLAGSWALRGEGMAAGRWVSTGLLGGVAVLYRPDSGLLMAAVGGTLVVVWLREVFMGLRRGALTRRPSQGFLLALAFAAVLAPWTMRNAVSIGVFQPLSPPHANMPGEFVPLGYDRWLRTWITDYRYIPAFEWQVGTDPLSVDQAPSKAFDSPEEKAEVAALFDRYNRGDSEAVPPAGRKLSPSMTPAIDANFAALAKARIARHPVRYYVVLPVIRAAGLWFDTHSLYYPFEGELFLVSALDQEARQGFWLPLFLVLVWLYTLAALAGARVLWREGNRIWLLLLSLLFIPRLLFFASLENPEPRYMVELFPFVCAVGALALATLKVRRTVNAGPS